MTTAKMIRINQSLILLILVIFITGCTAPVSFGLPPVVQAQEAEPTITPTLTPLATEVRYQVPIDATLTPTPFQPLAPTPVYLPTATPTITAVPSPTSTPEPTVQVAVLEVDQAEIPNQISILLLGSDKRKWGSGFRTDTIILATLNMDLGTVNLTSFPRDLYVDIPGWGADRINTAWAHGGFKTLAATLKQNFGVQPVHYVLIDFSSFKRVVDSLGGLDVEVKKPVSDYRNGRWVTIEKGQHHMDADLALWYARTRKTTNDFYRNRRQQEIIRAILNKLVSINGLLHIPELYETYKDAVTTDMTWDQMAPWLPLAAKLTDTSKLQNFYVGPEAAYDWITYEGAMVLIPRKDVIKKIIRQSLNMP